ncbi:UNVERIFIED_CONTAM: hypothetical protein RF648_19325, partial [Kocuria sp. CPCC 205274]
CFYHAGTKKPAGYKQYKHNGGYQWVLTHAMPRKDGTLRNVTHTLAKTIYELTTGDRVFTSRQQLTYLDGNMDNLKPDNLRKIRRSVLMSALDKRRAYSAFRNVKIKKTNPDYFKDPADWTDPEAVAALNAEKEKRLKGKKPPRVGSPPRPWNY